MAGTIGKIVADIPKGFGLTPPQEIKKKLTLKTHTIGAPIRFEIKYTNN
jgi:hypothetical protein